MNGRFWIFGVVVSVAVHAAFLFVLSFSSTSPSPVASEAPAEPTPSATAPSAPPPSVPEPVATPAPASSAPSAPHPPSRPVAVPAPHSVSLPVARPAPVHEPAPTPEKEWVTYVVKKGDMLERLVKKAGCSLSEAARYNKTTVKKLSALKVGQRIKLPKFQEN